MPASNTITAGMITDFAPATKARSSEVDQNFSVWRGHILPVDPNTSAAAAVNTYDLGSSDHYWRSGYFGTSLELLGATTTAGISLVQRQTTAGGLDIKLGGSTIASFDSSGLSGNSIGPRNVTISGATGIFSHITTISTTITGLVLTLTSRGGTVFVDLIHDQSVTSNSSYVEITGLTTTSTVVNAIFYLIRDGSTIQSLDLRSLGTNNGQGFRYPPSIVSFTDVSPSAGSHVYQIHVANGFSVSSLNIVRCRMAIYEL